MAYVQHRFFCLNCGKEGIPVYRKQGREREKFHRKKLYCPWCRLTVNHIECTNDAQVQKFKEEFAKGAYEDEAKESLLACGGPRLG